MSLKIIKKGLLDTVQDGGRYGFQHLGINPGGAMDRFSAALSNALLGKPLQAPVIEMHYPAPQLLFQKKTVFCLAGADFGATIDGEEIGLQQPVAVNAGTVLLFSEKRRGARCYLAVLAHWELEPWLNSYSTHLKAVAGGYKGKRLENGDEIPVGETRFRTTKNVTPLPWKYPAENIAQTEVAFLPGPEWSWLSKEAQTLFLDHPFQLSPSSDRMGFRLEGPPLEQEKKEQLLSSAVRFGTVQLLPNGQQILLMADHQTTGGYPRIANVISAHLPKLAQCEAGDLIRFRPTTLEAAEETGMAQQKRLAHLQITCNLKCQNWLNAHRY